MPLRHYHRKLDAGFVALPQMTGRRFGMPFILSPPTLTLRFRQNNGPTPSGDYQPSRSLSMAGSEGFYAAKKTRGAAVLTDKVLQVAQQLLSEGQESCDVADQLGIKRNTFSKAIRAGRLHKYKKKSQRY